MDGIEPVTFRRLYRKTNAAETNYPHAALISRKDFKVIRHQRRVEKKVHRTAIGVARAAAIRLLAAQPERVAEFESGADGKEVKSAACQIPHLTHDTARLANHP